MGKIMDILTSGQTVIVRISTSAAASAGASASAASSSPAPIWLQTMCSLRLTRSVTYSTGRNRRHPCLRAPTAGGDDDSVDVFVVYVILDDLCAFLTDKGMARF